MRINNKNIIECYKYKCTKILFLYLCLLFKNKILSIPYPKSGYLKTYIIILYDILYRYHIL